MTHRCWELDEIIRAIAAHLVLDKARASAVSLASCSKSLEEPALGEVWRGLSSLTPLVKCFPPEVWEIRDEILFFKRAPIRKEWSRFEQRYASKVQRLEVSSPDTEVSPSTLHLLQLCSPRSPLLPNLVSLNWDCDEAYLPFVLPFISHSLSSIVISAPRGASPILSPILTMLPTLSPDIREIEIGRFFHGPATEEASSQLLMHCDPYRLRRYNVDSPLSLVALRHIIQLPSLEEFWLVIDSSRFLEFHLLDPLPVIVFPTLRLLDVEYKGDHTWLKLLPAADNPVLTSIYVECPGPEVAQFMEAFKLTADECRLQERLQEFRVRSKVEFRISPEIIAWTFSFKNLTSLKVLSECSSSVCRTFDLTDGNIDLLTRAMPRLQTLAIGETPCGIPSQITFKSLYAISHRCQGLTTLQIHFNPGEFVTKVDTDREPAYAALGLSDPTPPLLNLCSVTTIDVGTIPVPSGENASHILALGLLGVFPRLEKLDFDDGDWEDIEELIEICRRMGHFTFRRG